MKFGLLHRYLTRATNRLSERQLMILLAIVVGFVTGVGVYIFEQLIYWIKYGLTHWFEINSVSYFYLIYPLVGILLVTLFVKYGVRHNISEGVTKVLYAISRRGSRLAPNNCYSSIVAGATTIGFGGSVGPESPIIMTGAAIGSNIGQFMRLNYRNTTLMLACGVAAACAAIFKAPITGVAFVLEILLLDITIGSIIPLLIAAVTATSLVFALRGFDPIFSVSIGNSFILSDIPYFIIMGVVAGLVAYYFTAMNTVVSKFFGRIKRGWLKIFTGGIVIGGLIFLFPPLYGEGYDSLVTLMNGRVNAIFNSSLLYEYRDQSWIVILYLVGILFFKVIAMASTNAAGGVGGVFAPSLFVGAFTGAATALTLNLLFGLNLSVVTFSLVGMAGVMSGVLDAPLTSIFLIAEMTDGYGLFVPLMIVSAISYVISYYFEPYSIYTRKLVLDGDLMTQNKDQAVLLFLDTKNLVESDFKSVTADMKLGALIKIVSASNRNIFPVLDSQKHLEGYVTLDDIRNDMFDSKKYHNAVSDYMTLPPEIISVDDSMQVVLAKFESSNAWNLPVINANHEYLGFVSKSKIFSAYRGQLLEISSGT